MNDCCQHLFREAKKELEIKDKRIAVLEAEATRLFEPTRKFWNERQGEKIEALESKLSECERELAQQRFNNAHNLSIDQTVADRIKELEQKLAESEKLIDTHGNQLVFLSTKLAVAINALEFYDKQSDLYTNAYLNFGKLAREAIAKIKAP